jgi:hypothetical protein
MGPMQPVRRSVADQVSFPDLSAALEDVFNTMNCSRDYACQHVFGFREVSELSVLANGHTVCPSLQGCEDSHTCSKLYIRSLSVTLWNLVCGCI